MFTPIQNDILNKIVRLKKAQKRFEESIQKHDRNVKLTSFSDPNNLLDMLNSELADDTGKAPAISALLWLKRGMWMFYYFVEITIESDGDVDLKKAFNQGYDKSLAKHHDWLVRTGIKMGLTVAAPSLDEFSEKMCSFQKIEEEIKPKNGTTEPEESSDVDFETCASFTDEEQTVVVLEELGDYIKPMRNVLDVIDEFYIEHDLDDLE